MTIEQIKEKLEVYETKINNSEKRKASLEGQQQMLLKKLNEEFNIKDFDSIDIIINDNSIELEQLEEEISSSLFELDTLFEEE